MKILMARIGCRLVNGTLGGLSLILLQSSSLLANTIPYQVTNGFYRSSSEDFFQQGKRQFEKEIQILMRQLLSEPESLLNISDEVQIKEEEVLENHNLSPDNSVNNKSQR
ncbi:MAG: hypothetical protein U7127_09435 [Phormidium sp.]